MKIVPRMAAALPPGLQIGNASKEPPVKVSAENLKILLPENRDPGGASRYIKEWLDSAAYFYFFFEFQK